MTQIAMIFVWTLTFYSIFVLFTVASELFDLWSDPPTLADDEHIEMAHMWLPVLALSYLVSRIIAGV